MSEVKEIGKLTPEEVEELRTKLGLKKGEISEVCVVDNREEVTKRYCYLKRLDKVHASLAMRNYRQDRIIEAGETIMAGGWIAGDETIKTDEFLNMSAAVIIADSTGFLPATLTRI